MAGNEANANEYSSEDINLQQHTPLENNDSIIRITVGPESHPFEVRENLLCSKCPFFKNALTGNYVESQTKTFHFPDDDPERFSELCQWLEHDSWYETHASPTWISLAKTWLFADKYHIDDLQNEVIDAINAKFAAHDEGINISFETLDYIAENAYPGSALRRIFADMLTNGISLQQLPERLNKIPLEFLQDMCLALKTTTSRNGPANTSLLTKPISSYYTDSSWCKATAMPKAVESSDIPPNLYCDGENCLENGERKPIREMLYFCSSHNLALCDECRDNIRGHRKKMISLTSAPYRSAITGERTTIVDGHVNDSGFYCDGPLCDPKGEIRKQLSRSEHGALMSGDRYHCLQCYNVDYCSICIRGELKCKDDGHDMLRIRPTFARKIPLTESVSIKLKQERLQKDLCWRCGDGGHETKDCLAKEAVLGPDLEVED